MCIYLIPLITTNKEGLEIIRVRSYTFSGNYINYLLDWVGMSANNTYYPNEFSFVKIDINDSFHVEHHNLLTMDIIGDMGLGVTAVGDFVLGTLIVDNTYYNETTNAFFNIYDYYQEEIFPNASFIFYLKTEFFVYSLHLEGVKMIEGINEYWLEYTHSGIDVNESYFWVDSSNRLRFSLIVDDNDPEWIEASFDIPDLLSENRSASFFSDRSGDSEGYFRVGYIGSSSLIPLSTSGSYQDIILPQHRTIEKLRVFITDNDQDNLDICTGYVTNVKLIYRPDLATTITTLNLIAVMIPIIIIIFPALAISKKLGKSSIVPVMLLMSVICFATELIPTWLFFIILLCGGAFLFMQRKLSMER